MTSTSDIARRAADEVFTRGLARGAMEDDQGRVCAGMALHRAAGRNHQLGDEAIVAFARSLRTTRRVTVVQNAIDTVWQWNDQRDMTAGEVIAAFIDFAKHLEEQEEAS